MNRYDRQTRIWGEYGQRCIESASICVIGAGGANCEALKSLILAGIGSYTIVDNRPSTKECELSNFAFKHSELLSRAECVLDVLHRLNPTSVGRISTIDGVLKSLDKFTIVIVDARSLPKSSCGELLDACIHKSIPVFLIHCGGSVGCYVPIFDYVSVIDVHVPFDVRSLGLRSPFKALEKLCDELDKEEDTSQLMIPWPLIVLRFSRIYGDAKDEQSKLNLSIKEF